MDLRVRNEPLSAGLYFVATPIGAARDITLRGLDILESADIIACEDTRTTKHLMTMHGLTVKGREFVAYHEHNADQAKPKLMADMKNGKSVVYVSEAGTPLVSDPGYGLSVAAIEDDIPVISAPGPTALITALTLSGLPSDRFMFVGFLPSKKHARETALKDLQTVSATLIFYESPKRVQKTVADMAQVLGGSRRGVICREITKKFEETLRGTLDELAAILQERTIKGEIVLLVDRADKPATNPQDVEAALTQALETMRIKDASSTVAEALNLPKRDVYQLALELAKKT
ncbi:MAG: 16S rRNA (cytidine(1402)-2'-O)-methyltransferase [Halocynthiibacter sp.]